MNDDLGKPINEGDIIIQGNTQAGLYYYRVMSDPDATKRMRVTYLDTGTKSALGKNPGTFLNLTALIGERYRDDEIVEMLRRPSA